MSIPTLYRAQSAIKHSHVLSTAKGFVGHTYAFLNAPRLRNKRQKPMAFFPYVPRVPYVYMVWSVLHTLSVPFKKWDKNSEKTILFWDKTLIKNNEVPQVRNHWINGHCLDARKEIVQKVYEKTFARSLAVNPETFTEPMVKKHTLNGTHSGEVVVAPQKRTEGYVYEKLINNVTSHGLVEDLRTTIVGSTLAAVFIKRRPEAERFKNYNTEVLIARPEDVFSPEERSQILSFAHAVGIDFGDVDVLRDTHSGELYIVDANPTSMAPPLLLSSTERIAILKNIAEIFETELLR